MRETKGGSPTCWMSLHFWHSLRNLRQPAELRRISLHVILPLPKGLVMTTSSFTLPSVAKKKRRSAVSRKPQQIQLCRPGQSSGTEAPSLGTTSVSRSMSMPIMESMELKKLLLMPDMGANKFWKPWKGLWNMGWMLLTWRGLRKPGRKKPVEPKCPWSATWERIKRWGEGDDLSIYHISSFIYLQSMCTTGFEKYFNFWCWGNLLLLSSCQGL